MDRSQFKNIARWLGRKFNKSNFAMIGYVLLLTYCPESLKLWLSEHNPDFLPEVVTYCVSLYSISTAIVYFPPMLINYLKKRVLSSCRNPA